MKRLTISGLTKLGIIWQKPSAGSSQWLKSLEILEISDCCSLREVFELDIKKPPPPPANTQSTPPPTIIQSTPAPANIQSTPPPPLPPPPPKMYSPLRKLLLQDLPELKHVWNKGPEDTIIFSMLESVTVSGCPGLNYLFPFSLAKENRLRRLQKLKVLNSGLKDIVAKGGVNVPAKFEFKKLTSLELRSLPPDGCFYGEKHGIELPLLEKFYFYSGSDELGQHGLHNQLTYIPNEVWTMIFSSSS